MDTHGFDKPYNYLRDAVWPNLRSRTLNKMDKKGKTGAESQVFDDIDNLVLDILGKDSPIVTGLNVKDTITIPITTVNRDCLADCFSETAHPSSSFSTLMFNASDQQPSSDFDNNTVQECIPSPPPLKKQKMNNDRPAENYFFIIK